MDKLLTCQPDEFKKHLAITSPLSGQVIELQNINDKLLRNGFMGPGAAISSTASIIKAPFDGIVLNVSPLDYAIEIKSSVGLKCRIKYGEDTHHLMGEKFICALNKGERFSKNDTLFTVNTGWLKQKGVPNFCIMTIMNAKTLIGVLPTTAKYVESGEDALLSLYL